MPAHAFVDESKVHGLLVVAAILEPRDLAQRIARRTCLARLVSDLAEFGAHRLVIEQDESLVRSDQKVLYRAVRDDRVEDVLTYEHLPARSEPLLWIPDALAWCWTAGGRWRQRIGSGLGEVVAL